MVPTVLKFIISLQLICRDNEPSHNSSRQIFLKRKQEDLAKYPSSYLPRSHVNYDDARVEHDTFAYPSLLARTDSHQHEEVRVETYQI